MNVWLRRAIGAAGIAVGYLLLQGQPAGASDLVHGPAAVTLPTSDIAGEVSAEITADPKQLAPRVEVDTDAAGAIETRGSEASRAQIDADASLRASTPGRTSVDLDTDAEASATPKWGDGLPSPDAVRSELGEHAGEAEQELGNSVEQLDDVRDETADIREETGDFAEELGDFAEELGDVGEEAAPSGGAGLLACLALCDWRRALCSAGSVIRNIG
jgi:hypothetical protein